MWRGALARGGLLRLALLLASCVLPLPAGEKNGVAPTTVSLPSGPGSIEGLGESFEPMLQTGTAGYSFPLAGAPGVGLSYDGGFGNGPAGYGWKYEPGAVACQLERGMAAWSSWSFRTATSFPAPAVDLLATSASPRQRPGSLTGRRARAPARTQKTVLGDTRSHHCPHAL